MIRLVLVKSTPGWCEGKVRVIPREKLEINGRTPVGEDADYYETKPHGGRKQVYPIAFIELDDHYKLVEWRDRWGSKVKP